MLRIAKIIISVTVAALIALIVYHGLYRYKDYYVAYQPGDTQVDTTPVNITLLNPKYLGYAWSPEGVKTASLVIADIALTLTYYPNRILLQNTVTFNLSVTTHNHRLPPGKISMDIQSVKDVDIYDDQGHKYLHGGPYQYSSESDSAHDSEDIKWRIVGTKSGDKILWINNLIIDVGKPEITLDKEEGFTNENFAYDSKDGTITGHGSVDFFVLRADGISETTYGIIQLVITVLTGVIGGGFVMVIWDRLTKKSDSRTETTPGGLVRGRPRRFRSRTSG
jgi:hypothetical protein